MQGQSQTIEVPPLAFRASVVPTTINEDKRTVELVWSTGAAVDRFDWMSGKRYREILSLDPKSVRLDRLNNGAPLLDAHSAYSIADQIGVVEPGSVRLAPKEARATVRFSKRATVDPIWQDVRDGITRNVSVGYRIFEFRETTGSKEGEIPTRTATSWEPYELSLVPMPADAGAQVRSLQSHTNSCVLVTRTFTGMTDDDRMRRFRLARVTR